VLAHHAPEAIYGRLAEVLRSVLGSR
jgi:hypothetical protein